MESRPQNPEFRNNPENFHPWSKRYNQSVGNLQTITTNFVKNNVYIGLTPSIHSHEMNHLKTAYMLESAMGGKISIKHETRQRPTD